MEREEDNRVCFCPYYLSGGSISATGCNSDKSISKPQIYCTCSFVFGISKSIQVASLELVNTQMATSCVDLLCCNEFGFNRIM